MFDELDLNSEAYGSFQEFCIATAIGACRPMKEEFHYNLLEHPVLPGEMIMLIYSAGSGRSRAGQFYLIKVVEGAGPDFVHPHESAFYFWTVGDPMLPTIAVVSEDDVTLTYNIDPNRAYSYISTQSRVTSRENYEMLKRLFDKDNPYPWKEFSAFEWKLGYSLK